MVSSKHCTGGARSTDRDSGRATMITMTSIENYCMTVAGRFPGKGSWYLDCATTSHVCGDQRKFEWSTEYTKRDERVICEFVGMVAGKAIGHRDERVRLWLPGSRHRIHEVVTRNVLHVAGAHNSLSQFRLMDRGLLIVPVIGYGTKIYNKSPAEDSAQGRGQGSLVGVARQIGGLFRLDVKRLDVKVAGKRYRARG